MTALLELDGVSKSFGALKATDSLTLTVETGEALAVIGPNGAGKSTMFNLITGDLAPDTGRIRFAGADITGLAAHTRSRPMSPVSSSTSAQRSQLSRSLWRARWR